MAGTIFHPWTDLATVLLLQGDFLLGDGHFVISECPIALVIQLLSRLYTFGAAFGLLI